MRPKENIEKFVRVRKPLVTTSRQMDKRTLDDSFAVMEQTFRAKAADNKMNAPRVIIRSRMIKLTAAAVIIVGIGLHAILVHQGQDEQPVTKIAKYPVEMMTAMSLERAFRRGGLEAVDDQCRKAFRSLELRPGSLSFEQILAEFNGNSKSSEGTGL
ncbi:MAG: hypothetical protein ACYS32_16530 [Planctomycetota bacterium]|jgi:hypothetical protein